jgi:predicted  nucleic acid-binding Zn-ribbon protein
VTAGDTARLGDFVCRASTAESDRLKRDSSHKEAALQKVTKHAADAAEESSRLRAELQSLNAQNTDLTTRATMEASNARQAADLSMSMERMHEVLQKEASDQRVYFEVRHGRS